MDSLQLWHQDPTLLVVEKPAELLAVPGRGEAGAHNLATLVQTQFADALVVHRLDMSTSGLMLFARGATMQSLLNKAFAQRRVSKRYEAVVEGWLDADQGSITAPLAADWPLRPRQKVDPANGKASLTHWRVLQRFEHAGQKRTRMELQPHTGRSHQLRVHLQHLGHPIVGDNLYGQSPALGERMLLHACHLHFEHPQTAQAMSFNSPVPF